MEEYKGSNYPMSNIDIADQIFKQKFEDKASAFNQQKIDDTSLKESVALINQFKKRTQEVQALMGKDNMGSEFAQTEKSLDNIVAKLKEFGINVSGGQLSFDKTADGAVKSAKNVAELKQKIDETNDSISILDGKTNDAFKVNEENEYKQKVAEVTATIKQYVDAVKQKQMLESVGASSAKKSNPMLLEYVNLANHVDKLRQKLKEYGIETDNCADETEHLVFANKSFIKSYDDVAEAID